MLGGSFDKFTIILCIYYYVSWILFNKLIVANYHDILIVLCRHQTKNWRNRSILGIVGFK